MAKKNKIPNNVYSGVIWSLQPPPLKEEGIEKPAQSLGKQTKDKVPTTYFAVPGRGTNIHIF